MKDALRKAKLETFPYKYKKVFESNAKKVIRIDMPVAHLDHFLLLQYPRNGNRDLNTAVDLKKEGYYFERFVYHIEPLDCFGDMSTKYNPGWGFETNVEKLKDKIEKIIRVYTRDRYSYEMQDTDIAIFPASIITWNKQRGTHPISMWIPANETLLIETLEKILTSFSWGFQQGNVEKPCMGTNRVAYVNYLAYPEWTTIKNIIGERLQRVQYSLFDE